MVCSVQMECFIAQLTFICSNSTIETLEKGVIHMLKVNNKIIIDVVLVF